MQFILIQAIQNPLQFGMIKIQHDRIPEDRQATISLTIIWVILTIRVKRSANRSEHLHLKRRLLWPLLNSWNKAFRFRRMCRNASLSGKLRFVDSSIDEIRSVLEESPCRIPLLTLWNQIANPIATAPEPIRPIHIDIMTNTVCGFLDRDIFKPRKSHRAFISSRKIFTSRRAISHRLDMPLTNHCNRNRRLRLGVEEPRR